MIYKYKISPFPFHHFKTEELILAIRNKNYELSCVILDNYKYIVLDYDYFHFLKALFQLINFLKNIETL